MGYRKQRFVFFVTLACLFGLWADGPSQAEIKAPVEFDIARMKGLGDTLSACLLNPLGQVAMDFMNKESAGACGGSDALFDKPQCEDFRESPELPLSTAKLNEYEKRAKEAEKTLKCKISQAKSAESQLLCIQNYSTQLNEMIGSLKGAYTQNLATFRNGVQQYEADEADIHARGESLMQIMGDEEKKSGLIGARANSMKIIEQMPDEIRAVRETQKVNAEARKSLEAAIAKRPFAIMDACFSNKVVPNQKCTTDGPDLSTRDYILCMAREIQRVGPKGQIQKGKVVKKQGSEIEARLKTVLDQLSGSLPADTTTSRSQDENIAKLSRTGTIESMDQLKSKFGSVLSSFNGKGLDVNGIVMNRLSACYNEGLKDVERERKTPDTFIYGQQEKIKSSEDGVKTQVSKLLNKYTLLYGDNMTALTNMNMPLNTVACENADPTGQLKCLDDMRQQTMNLLKGIGDGTAMKLYLKGTKQQNDAAPLYNVNCRGINGCITALKNVSNQMRNNLKMTTQAKQKYVSDSNEQIKKFTSQMASMMSTQSAVLQQMATKAQAAMAAIGAGRRGFKLDTVRPEKLRQGKLADGSPGLFEEPENMLGVVSWMMNQPLNKADPEDIGEALSHVAKEKKEFEEKIEKTLALEMGLKKTFNGCLKKEKSALNKDALDKIRTLNKCNRDAQWCAFAKGRSDIDLDALGTAFAAVKISTGEIGGEGTQLTEAINRLKTGIEGCVKGTNSLAQAQLAFEKMRALFSRDNVESQVRKINEDVKYPKYDNKKAALKKWVDDEVEGAEWEGAYLSDFGELFKENCIPKALNKEEVIDSGYDAKACWENIAGTQGLKVKSGGESDDTGKCAEAYLGAKEYPDAINKLIDTSGSTGKGAR